MMQKVAVLMGGHSAERVISLRSGERVAEALNRLGYEVVPFDPARRSYWELATEKVDRAFVVLHGRGGEDGTAQAILEWLAIPYTGSGVLASALAMDKWRTKLIWRALGLPVIPGVRVTLTQWQTNPDGVRTVLAAIPAPWFVKPVHEGSSVGAGVAVNWSELTERLAAAFTYDSEVLVEQQIRGRELTVAFLDDEILPAIEIVAASAYYDYHAKYESNATQYRCPAPLTGAEAERLAELVRLARDALGCSGWGRVDLLWDETGPKLLEINTAPGMTDHSLVPMAARAVGLSFEALCGRILASARYQGGS